MKLFEYLTDWWSQTKERSMESLTVYIFFVLLNMVNGHYSQFSANQIWTDSTSRFVELLNFCFTFVLPTLTWKYWEINRAFEFLWWFDWFVQIPCQICLTSDLWAFSDVDPATTLSSSHWAIVHDRTILRGNYHNFRVYFKDWKNAFRQLELLLHEDLQEKIFFS